MTHVDGIHDTFFFVDCFSLSISVQGLVVPVLRNVERMNYADVEKVLKNL